MKIYYIANDCNDTVGGTKVAYQHVELLRELGHDAWIVHQQSPFRPTWFKSSAPVAYWYDGLDYPDLWVVPEGFACPVTQDVVIFNQNHHFTFWPESPTARFHNVLGTMVVSENSQRYLNYAFPGHPVTVIHNFVDESIFKPALKENLICYMPRRGYEYASQLFGLLRAKGYQFEISAIDGKMEKEVAYTMNHAKVYIHFGLQEGEALPILEATASGCHVIQFDPFRPEECCFEIFKKMESLSEPVKLPNFNKREVTKESLRLFMSTIKRKELTHVK